MRRRRYLTKVGTGLSIGIAGLAGCGAPGEQTETGGGAETTVGGANETTAGIGTETTTGGANETTAGGANETTAGGTNETTGGAEETGTGTGGGAGAPNEVAMITEDSEYIFDPIGLFVEPGESITWRIESGSHSSTAYTQDNPQSEVRRIPEQAQGWNSETLSESGATFSHTFEVQGTYDYYCIPHKTLGMVARIVVGEPSGIEGDPPDGPVPAEDRIVQEGAVSASDFNP